MGNNQCAGLLVGVLVVFLCSHVFITVCWWWVWVRVWVGHRVLASRHTVGFTFNTVLASAIVVVVARIACLGFEWFGCGCVWWVVCDLYSGCEHICSVLFFCVLFSFVGHSVDALASRADEGRCGLRYASGSWRASVIIRGCPNGGT